MWQHRKLLYRHPSVRRPRLETLEDRCLLSRDSLVVQAAPSGPDKTTSVEYWTNVPDLSGSIATAAGSDLAITVAGEAYTTAGTQMALRALVDGQPAGPSDVVFTTGGDTGTHSFTFAKTGLDAGPHVVQVQWSVGAAGGTAFIGDRTLTLHALPVPLSGVPVWTEQGPRPIINDTTGAVESIAINPNPNPDKTSQIYVGSANGGVWRTNKADPSDPDATEWDPLTDQLPSLSMGDIAFSPLDPSWKTLFAGTGIFSSDHEGGPAIGVVRTTDGGATWKVFPLNPGGPEFRVKTILPTSIDLDAGPGIREIVLVGTVGGGGLYRSDDNGQSYTLLSGAKGLPTGDVSQLIVDPNNNQRFYAGVPNKGIFRGDYDPVTSQINWTPVNTGINPTSISTAGNIQIAAGNSSGSTVLFALLSGSSRCAFRSTNGGAMWTPLATPPENFGNDNTMGKRQHDRRGPHQRPGGLHRNLQQLRRRRRYLPLQPRCRELGRHRPRRCAGGHSAARGLPRPGVPGEKRPRRVDRRRGLLHPEPARLRP